MAKDRVVTAGTFDDSVRRIVDRNFPDVSLCTAALTKNADTTLADITGMTTDVISLAPGTYRFSVFLATTAGASGGLKVAFKYNNGLTLTSIEATSKAFTASAVAVAHTTTTTDQTSLIANTAAVIKGEIDGTMVIATAGSIQLQAAQNASNGTDTVILVGSRMEFTRVGI